MSLNQARMVNGFVLFILIINIYTALQHPIAFHQTVLPAVALLCDPSNHYFDPDFHPS